MPEITNNKAQSNDFELLKEYLVSLIVPLPYNEEMFEETRRRKLGVEPFSDEEMIQVMSILKRLLEQSGIPITSSLMEHYLEQATNRWGFNQFLHNNWSEVVSLIHYRGAKS